MRAVQEGEMLIGNIILRLEASERYLRCRLEFLSTELLSVDHPLLKYEDICINEKQEAVILCEIYLEDASFKTRTFKTPTGERVASARPMFEAWLTVGPAVDVTRKGNPDDAPPILQDMSIKDDDLILELLDSKIIVHLGPHPKAMLEITDHISCYTVKHGLLREFIRESPVD